MQPLSIHFMIVLQNQIFCKVISQQINVGKKKEIVFSRTSILIVSAVTWNQMLLEKLVR